MIYYYQNCRSIHQPHSAAFELPPPDDDDDFQRRRHGQRIPATAATELPTSDGSEAATAELPTPAALAEADPGE